MNRVFKRLSTSLMIAAALTAATACTPDTSAEATVVNKERVQSDKPNIVVFYVDDLGWGDLSSYGATAVQTPNVDQLAENGIRYTDAHTSSATCTPSRYSLLTGEHGFRRGISILRGDAKMVIGVDQPTIPKMLKKAGYTSAVVGKWHLGLGDGKNPIDWNTAVKPGPLEIGFDYSYLIPATGDRVPSVYLENHHVENLDPNDPLSVSYEEKIGDRPTGYENPELQRYPADKQHNKTLINGIGRIGWMKGGKSAEWVDEDFPHVMTNKANAFIDKNADKPFFLFFSFHDIHVPRLPNKMFAGKTDMGVRGDAIVQMDWMTGQVVDHIKSKGLLDNTIIIFTSDNGAVLTDGYDDEALTRLGDHKPNGPYRGGKYSALEAGTRVPFIVHYPKGAKTGVNNSLVSQLDIYASMAKLLNVPLENNEAIDSQENLDALLDPTATARDYIVEQAFTLSVRDGDWKYITPAKSRGWIKNQKNIESGASTKPQLFNVAEDPSELNNLAKKHPERVKKMAKMLKDARKRKTRLTI